ncbi:antibiotic biosynthesis monooxygenase [Rhizobium sp. LjRoot30]|uniref:putative quinol monooxygenase n=1 Tax=Rhizobium sp. LjRoot30 TaxID=3342320 RepID=UPI003ED04430
MKLIVGYFTAKPGRRNDFLAAVAEHARLSREEPGCLYFDLVAVPDHPDRMLLAEAFVSDEAHRIHEDTDHMRAVWKVMPELLVHASLDIAISDDIQHIEDDFSTPPGPSH